MLNDEHDEAPVDDAADAFAESVDEDRIPHHTKPFRAWGAAHESRERGPSLWARFRGWLAGLFRRNPPASESGEEFPESRGAWDTPAVVEPGVPSAIPLETSDHGAESPWGESDPTEHSLEPSLEESFDHPGSPEPPHSDDFGAPWGDPFAKLETPAAPETADPLWDEPRIAESATPPAEAITGQDLDFVWSPPAPSADQLLSESKPAPDESPSDIPRRPKRMSFISRLFSGKNKPDTTPDEERFAAFGAASEFPDQPREQAPAVDDFADTSSTLDVVEPADVAHAHPSLEHSAEDAAQLADLLAGHHSPRAETPTEDVIAADETAIEDEVGDFESVREIEPPIAPRVDSVFDLPDEPPTELPIEATVVDAEESVDVSALEPQPPEAAPPETSAAAEAKKPSLFSRLMWRRSQAQPLVVEPAIADRVAETVEQTPAAEPATELGATSHDDTPPVERETDFAAASGGEVDNVLDEIGTEDVVDPALLESQAPEIPVAPQPKKVGFFSRLMWRRSQPPMPAVESPIESPVEEPAGESASELIEAPADEPLAEIVDEALVVETETEAASDAEVTFGETVEIPPDEAQAPAAELPVPFAPFRDARDDFHDEPVAAPTSESSRITEAVPQPTEDAFAEGEKTDEFEVVPAPDAQAEAAAEEPAGFFGRLFGRNKAETTQPVPVVGRPGGTIAEAGRDEADKPPFVLAKFRMFYNEIIRDKHQKSDVISGFATAIVTAAAADMADPEFAAQLLSKRLSEMLELQAAESNWTGGDAVKYYPDAQYAMVCLADETFSHIDWPGRPSWHKYKLEPKMYGTRAADTELFRRIDKLLREPNPPKGARDLARVYLLVIASGFRGLFREPNLKRPLAEYRRRLYEFSHQTDPLELYGRDRKLLPEAAEHTLAGRAVGRFTPAQKWIAAVIILLVIYATVSHIAWIKLSADLKDVMSRIELSTGPTGGAR